MTWQTVVRFRATAVNEICRRFFCRFSRGRFCTVRGVVCKWAARGYGILQAVFLSFWGRAILYCVLYFCININSY